MFRCFLFLMFLMNAAISFAQVQKQVSLADQQSDKDPFGILNSKREHLPTNQFQDFYFYNISSDGELGQVADYLDKLDEKIVRVVYVPQQKKMKLFYSIDVQVIDIMQGLKSIGYPVYYIVSNGDHASINEYGSIELIKMNK